MFHRRSRNESGIFYSSTKKSINNLSAKQHKLQNSKRWYNKQGFVIACGILFLVYSLLERLQVKTTQLRQLQAEQEFMSWTQCPASIEQAKGLYTNVKVNDNNHTDFAQNTVLLTAANLGYLPMLQTWEAYASSLNLKWAVLALDDWMFQHENAVETHSEFFLRRFQRYNSEGYWSLQCNIWRSILSIIERCEVDIIFSEVDNILVQDPFAAGSDLGEKLRSNLYDYMYATDFPLSRRKQNECPAQRFPTKGESTGFFYIRQDNEPMKHVMRQILNECLDNSNDVPIDFWKLMARRGYSHCNSNNNETKADLTGTATEEDLKICCMSSAEIKTNRRYNMEGRFSTYEKDVLNQIHNSDESVKSWHLNVGHRKLMKLLQAGLYQQRQAPDEGEQKGKDNTVEAEPEVVEPNQLLQASADIVQQVQQQQEEKQQEVVEPNQLLQISAEVAQQKQQEEESKTVEDNSELQQERLHQSEQETSKVVEPNQLLHISADIVQQKHEEALQEEVLRSANNNNQVKLESNEANVAPRSHEKPSEYTNSSQVDVPESQKSNATMKVANQTVTATRQQEKRNRSSSGRAKHLLTSQQQQALSNNSDQVMNLNQSLADVEQKILTSLNGTGEPKQSSQDTKWKENPPASKVKTVQTKDINSTELMGKGLIDSNVTEALSRNHTLRPLSTQAEVKRELNNDNSNNTPLGSNQSSMAQVQNDDAASSSTKKRRKKKRLMQTTKAEGLDKESLRKRKTKTLQ